jgi:glc operon protein GlcG
MPLTTEECRRLIDAAHARAGQIGIRVTVAVVDEGGLLLALSRMDGGSLAQVAQDRPAFFQAVGKMSRVPVIPGLGSTLVRRKDAVLGAVGVSGGKPEQDLDCAEAGLRAI